MTAWIRVLLYIVTGWLMGRGYISDEIRDMINADPAVVESLTAAVNALIVGIPLGWWRLAKRMGWST